LSHTPHRRGEAKLRPQFDNFSVGNPVNGDVRNREWSSCRCNPTPLAGVGALQRSVGDNQVVFGNEGVNGRVTITKGARHSFDHWFQAGTPLHDGSPIVLADKVRRKEFVDHGDIVLIPAFGKEALDHSSILRS
jgi:hypothetical protein